jgi:hypothetical protein
MKAIETKMTTRLLFEQVAVVMVMNHVSSSNSCNHIIAVVVVPTTSSQEPPKFGTDWWIIVPVKIQYFGLDVLIKFF